ncbi:MAG: HAD-IA family hydrolase, partial [Bacteroidales bacterium]|nr:HAD-IA family hydrolase [Bacteroidales bacterium]
MKKVKIHWLLLDIGDVLLLKNQEHDFNKLLSHELNIDINLAKKINKEHYTTMDAKYLSEEKFIANLAKNLGYKAPKNIFSHFSRAYKNQVHPNTKLLNFLKKIRKSGIKTAILSNTIAIYKRRHQLAGISKKSGFAPIIYSWEVEKLKPQKDIFKLTLKKLNAQPNEIIFIDDKTSHLQSAKQIGIKTIQFDNTDHVISQIQSL